MTTELYKKHRPRDLSQLIGQDEAVATLSSLLAKKRFPHALLLAGPSGTGKTTAARIIRRKLGCSDHDYHVVQCPRVEGALEKVREIADTMRLSPMVAGGCRVYHLEEAQALSRASFAQQALLELLEDTPKHVYFTIATTEPEKLHRAILTRCTKVTFKPLSTSDLIRVQTETLALGGRNSVPKSVLEAVADASDGSAREALVLLNSVLDLRNEKEQLAAILKADAKGKTYELVKMLVFEPKAPWSKVARIVESIDDEPEKVRRSALGFARKMLLTDKNAGRAFFVLCCFESPWYDSGNAGLARAAYEVFSNKD